MQEEFLKIKEQDVKLIEKEEEREKKKKRKKNSKSKYTEALDVYEKENYNKENTSSVEITIKFNSKKYTVFDPNNLIPDYLKPYIKYDGKATEKKGGKRRRAGQKPNSAIFRVKVKDKKYLYHLRYVIKDHAATLNENPDEPIVILNSITIYDEGKKRI